jgi:hypothetical protein
MLMNNKFLLVVLLGVLNVAHAGRPIETDDASAAEFRTCQLDYWTETAKQVRQDNFNAGCNFFGSGELGVGLGDLSGNGEDQSLRSLGYKHIIQDFSANAIGYGLAVSKEWGELKANNDSSQETLFTAISTVPLAGDDLLLHLNLGYLKYSDQTLTDESLFKAAALDYSLNDRFGLSVETYSGVQDSLSWRVGARYILVPDFLQIDASYGSDYGTFNESRAFTIGLGITPAF